MEIGWCPSVAVRGNPLINDGILLISLLMRVELISVTPTSKEVFELVINWLCRWWWLRSGRQDIARAQGSTQGVDRQSWLALLGDLIVGWQLATGNRPSFDTIGCCPVEDRRPQKDALLSRRLASIAQYYIYFRHAISSKRNPFIREPRNTNSTAGIPFLSFWVSWAGTRSLIRQQRRHQPDRRLSQQYAYDTCVYIFGAIVWHSDGTAKIGALVPKAHTWPCLTGNFRASLIELHNTQVHGEPFSSLSSATTPWYSPFARALESLS